LQDDWDIDVITAAENAEDFPNLTVHHVPGPTAITNFNENLRSLRLDKLSDLLTWPDPYWPWIFPALRKAEHLVETRSPDAALVFMMPFSTGIVGTLLKVRTGLPLVFNLDDSPTCSDMHPTYPSWLHYRLFQWLEDYYIRASDRTVYVSLSNRDRVQARQPADHAPKLHLIRCSAEPSLTSEHSPLPQTSGEPSMDEKSTFRIVYTGAMNGWYTLDDRPPSLSKRLYYAWQRLGTHVHAPLDRRSHSPVFVGEAVRQVIERRPEWKGRICVEVYGNTYPTEVIDRVLQTYRIDDIVRVHGRVPADEVSRYTRGADLLFLTLPDRLDGTPGGRISLKTYEYLMTDRPILAAVPPGENRDFLRDKPGTYLTDPTDAASMSRHIETLVAERFAGAAHQFDRSDLQNHLSSAARADALTGVLETAIAASSLKSKEAAPAVS
jgi:hypothetical protein